MASRFQPKKARGAAADDRVGEIMSDSSVSSIEEDDARLPGPRLSPGSAAAPAKDRPSPSLRPLRKKMSPGARESPADPAVRPAAAMKKAASRKWYNSDSETDDQASVRPAAINTAAKASSKESEVSAHEEKKSSSPPSVASPASESEPPRKDSVAAPTSKPTSFQKLVAKTKTLSPFASIRKGLDVASPQRTPVNSALDPASPASVVSEVATTPARERKALPQDALRSSRRTASQRGMSIDGEPEPLSSNRNLRRAVSLEQTETPAPINRRTSRLKQPPASSEYGSSGPPSSNRSLDTQGQQQESPSAAVFSPSGNKRKTLGAVVGKPGSGVLLEGWLRQKQRRGVKGMKKWNSRYFVLYAKTNEIRYYADVVASAWGPIPLGEIGSISLRLIQRISKLSNPKYNGCRVDITCRNTWGTHYADDYVSSEEENNNNTNEAEGGKPAKNTTPRSTRVYSLMTDSPQTTVTWCNMLDSLLVRSANSPRIDVGSNNSNAPSSGKNTKRASTNKALSSMRSRRSTSTLDTETLVLAGDSLGSVPTAVTIAINFIFDSSPGIETDRFYELEPEPAKLKAGLEFLNQSAANGALRPDKTALESVLDAVTAGAIVKLWLKQMEQPLVPFEMYHDFCSLAKDAPSERFDLQRNLKALVQALPRRNFAMLACLLFHLNDVNVYSSKNGMDSTVLAALFTDSILRPRPSSSDPAADADNNSKAESERALVRDVVREMIEHIDNIIDEKEEELLNRTQ